ncbi:MAG: hypothetical protein ABS76_26005 [Pelagibacterium sp. SCN 64-44]|nr:MAG: hypothetical protein ABS76_26005 [Pelagibacterium sp. SCN 64-44]
MLGNLAHVALEYFADDGRFPNSTLPVLIYRQALPPEAASAEALEQLFDGNGWPSQWRAGVYDYDHYHSTAHECLGVASGAAVLRLGGPEGRDVSVKAGDVLLLPAGIAHRRVEAAPDFLIVGAYPPGQDWDVLTGADGERPSADQRIAQVPLPQTDPVGGRGGPALEKWR